MTEKPATYTTTTSEPPALSGAPPQDLSPQAIALAVYIQELPAVWAGDVNVVKLLGGWLVWDNWQSGIVVLAPPDKIPGLHPRSVKLSRRVQSLRNGRVYKLVLVKQPSKWILCVQGEGKAEVIR